MEGLLLLALLVERLTEYFGNPLIAQFKLPAVTLRYLALALGLAIALGGQLNAFVFMPGVQSLAPVIGYVLTGFLLGGGSSILHDFIPGPVHA
jgi:hypothetical protein